MVTAADFTDLLLSQKGDRYIFGHEVDLSDTNPAAFDCSELVEWGAYQLGVQPRVPDGSWYQARHCQKHGTLIPIVEAVDTQGALLFRFSGDPFTGGRPRSSHVAVSLGDGRTIEARGSRYGVGVFTADGRGWTHAGLVPGINYEGDDMALTDDQAAALDWLVAARKRKEPRPILAAHFEKARAAGVFTEHTKPGNPVVSEELAAFLDRAGAFDQMGVDLDALAQEVANIIIRRLAS